jgi:hypothetical protein
VCIVGFPCFHLFSYYAGMEPRSSTALSPFLSRDELVILTGYRQPSCMCRWLTNNRWPFVPPANNRAYPVVARRFLERLLHDAPSEHSSSGESQARPNFNAFDRRHGNSKSA